MVFSVQALLNNCWLTSCFLFVFFRQKDRNDKTWAHNHESYNGDYVDDKHAGRNYKCDSAS